MIVQCPSCASRYRVDGANIPSAGGRIQCPSCGHGFVVYPKASEDPAGQDKASAIEQPDSQELLRGMEQSGEERIREEMSESGSYDFDDFDEVFDEVFDEMFDDDDQTMQMSNPVFKGAAFSERVMTSAPLEANEDQTSEDLSVDFVHDGMERVRNQTDSVVPVENSEEALSAKSPPSVGDELPEPPQMPSPPELPPKKEQKSDISQQSTVTPTPTAAPEPDSDHEGPWKLQTSFGLTYEFADSKILKNWLESRDELEGYKLSADGSHFYELTEFPQFRKRSSNSQSGSTRRIGATGKQSAASSDYRQGSSNRDGKSVRERSSPTLDGLSTVGELGSGSRSPFTTANTAIKNLSGGQEEEKQETEKEKIDPNEMFRPPARDGLALNIVLWGAFGVLGIAAVVLALHLGGVIDLFEREEPANVIAERSVPGDNIDGDSKAEQAERLRSNPEVDPILEIAREDLESNRLSSALDRLQRVVALDPDNLEAYEGKMEVYERLGQTDEVERVRERIKELYEAGAGEGAATGDEVEASSEVAE